MSVVDGGRYSYAHTNDSVLIGEVKLTSDQKKLGLADGESVNFYYDGPKGVAEMRSVSSSNLVVLED